MPAIAPGATVAVTGANGFLASHIVQSLIDQGFKVRACVRDPSNEEKTAHLKSLPGAAESLTLCQGDLLQPNSYDDAFAGCDAVVHAAAVVDIFSAKGKEAEDKVVAPSVTGTNNVIASINAAGSVQRVVQTSSVAAVLRAGEPDGTVFTEADWNTWGTLDNGDAYGLAKVRAEQVATEASRVDGVSWDYVAINPHVILGPVMCKAHTKSSAALVRQIVYGNALNNYYCQFVDVRDVARAHVEALLRPEASGTRNCLTNDSPCMNTMDLVPIAVEACPDYVMSAKAQYGSCGVWFGSKFGLVNEYQHNMFTKRFEFKNDHSKQVLGIQYRPIEETVRDTAMSMIDGGFIRGKKK